jgi:hypothetical protein
MLVLILLLPPPYREEAREGVAIDVVDLLLILLSILIRIIRIITKRLIRSYLIVTPYRQIISSSPTSRYNIKRLVLLTRTIPITRY